MYFLGHGLEGRPAVLQILRQLLEATCVTIAPTHHMQWQRWIQTLV